MIITNRYSYLTTNFNIEYLRSPVCVIKHICKHFKKIIALVKHEIQLENWVLNGTRILADARSEFAVVSFPLPGQRRTCRVNERPRVHGARAIVTQVFNYVRLHGYCQQVISVK